MFVKHSHNQRERKQQFSILETKETIYKKYKETVSRVYLTFLSLQQIFQISINLFHRIKILSITVKLDSNYLYHDDPQFDLKSILLGHAILQEVSSAYFLVSVHLF